jgi:hypothetical protein
MGTEDELKRCGQAAAALMGVAAARAKQVAEQLLGSRESAKQDAKHRAESLVDEGRRAAADVVSALRKEASVLFRDLENLEEHLRGGKGGGEAAAESAAASGGEKVGRPRKESAGKAAASTKAPGGRQTAEAAKATTAKATTAKATTAKATTAKAPRARQSASAAKTPGAAESAVPQKVAGARKKAVAAKASAPRKAGGARKAGGTGPSDRGRA